MKESRTRSRSTADRKSVELGRRELFAAGAAAGITLGAAGLIRCSPEPEAKQDHRSLAYRETDHIRAAYRRMRF